MKNFNKLKKEKRLIQSKKNMELIQIYLHFLNKITIITHFRTFFCVFSLIFPRPRLFMVGLARTVRG